MFLTKNLYLGKLFTCLKMQFKLFSILDLKIRLNFDNAVEMCNNGIGLFATIAF